MHQYSLNNWVEWYYDDELYGRQDLNNFKKYVSRYNCNIKEVGTYKEELHKTAISTLEHFDGKDLTLCFSGGIDSEVILRTYLEIGHKLNVVIYRYEDNLNDFDIHYATQTCDQLNVSYRIIDFNIKKFFENDAAAMIKPCQVDMYKPLQLIGCRFLEITEGVPIVGEGELWVTMRPAGFNPENKLNYYWANCEHSSEIVRELYLTHLNKKAIPKWFQWRPEILLCALESEYMKKLTSNQYKDVYCSLDNLYELYKPHFPDLIKRPKYSGFERCVDLPVVNEFKKEILKQNGEMLEYYQPYDRTIRQTINELRGVSIMSKN